MPQKPLSPSERESDRSRHKQIAARLIHADSPRRHVITRNYCNLKFIIDRWRASRPPRREEEHSLDSPFDHNRRTPFKRQYQIAASRPPQRDARNFLGMRERLPTADARCEIAKWCASDAK